MAKKCSWNQFSINLPWKHSVQLFSLYVLVTSYPIKHNIIILRYPLKQLPHVSPNYVGHLELKNLSAGLVFWSINWNVLEFTVNWAQLNLLRVSTTFLEATPPPPTRFLGFSDINSVNPSLCEAGWNALARSSNREQHHGVVKLKLLVVSRSLEVLCTMRFVDVLSTTGAARWRARDVID